MIGVNGSNLSYLGLTLVDTFCDCSPNVALVLPQRLSGLALGESSDGVLVRLVANIGRQGHHSLHHVLPVLVQPGHGVHAVRTAVVQGHLNVLGSVATLAKKNLMNESE